MASAFIISVPAETATLLHTAGHHGASVFLVGSALIGGTDVDGSHHIQLNDGTMIPLGPDESLYAWSGSGTQITVLVTNDV